MPVSTRAAMAAMSPRVGTGRPWSNIAALEGRWGCPRRVLTRCIEIAVEAEKLGNGLLKRYPKALVVAGQLIFEEDTGWNIPGI